MTTTDALMFVMLLIPLVPVLAIVFLIGRILYNYGTLLRARRVEIERHNR